jgi:pimeloyl-ACP methyl ester carboxylesterase
VTPGEVMMRWSLEHGMMVRRFGGGPELVWLHGLGEWSPSFDAVAVHPVFAGFAHVLPDLPGYGRSPWPDEPDGLEQLADRVAAWLAERPGERQGAPPVLIGHSMGGVLATLVAERIAVRAVVDVEGNLSRGDCNFSAPASAYLPDDFVAHGYTAMRADVHERGRTDVALRDYHAAMCAASPRAFHRHAVDLVAMSESGRLAPRLAGLGVPTLFVAGVPDGICEYSRGLLDHHGVRWVGIEPAGHWVHCDQPEAFASAVAGFLRAS